MDHLFFSFTSFISQRCVESLSCWTQRARDHKH